MNNSKIGLLPFIGEASLESLKKASLLFEKNTLAFVTSIPRARRARFPLSRGFYSEEQVARISAELAWLHDNGFLDSPDTDPFATGFEMEDFDSDRPVWCIRGHGHTAFLQMQDSAFSDTHPEIPNLVGLIEDVQQLTIEGIEKRPSALRNHVLISSGVGLSSGSVVTRENGQNGVLDIVIDRIPQPSIDTPWEALLDWRNDEEAKSKFLRLKVWMNSISTQQDVNMNHLKEEVDYLIDEYRQYMKIQNAKFSSGTLRSIVVGAAEIMESVAKLKLKNLAEMSFQISQANIELKAAEFAAPGRELAYIVHAQNQFKK